MPWVALHLDCGFERTQNSGEIVYHDCAVVFIGDKALPMDPAYQWFGAPLTAWPNDRTGPAG